MKPTQSFNSYIENSIKDNWDRDALTDYKGATLQYHDVARKIAKLHILFRHSGLQPGDKVALCGRNSSAWAAAFLATITYGAVAVPIQHEFTPDMVYNIVNHSESRLLFVGDVVSPTIDAGEMPALEGIIYIPDFSLTMSRSETLTFAREHLNKLFGEEYPKAFERSHVSYHQDSPEELAEMFRAQRGLEFKGGMLVTNPIPEEYSMDKEVIDKAIDQALAECKAQGVHGKETTPFLLARVVELTGGDSLESNIQLVLNNARLAARTACALAK